MKPHLSNIFILSLLFIRVLFAPAFVSFQEVSTDQANNIFSHFTLRKRRSGSDVNAERVAVLSAEITNIEEGSSQRKRLTKIRSFFSNSIILGQLLFKPLSFSETIFKDLFLRYAVLRV